MASSIEFVDFVCRQISPAGDVSWRKMFGDYVVYLDGKPVFTVCDDTCYAKDLPAVARPCPTPSAAALTTGPASTSSSTWGTASLPCGWPGRCGRRCPSRRSEAARAEPGAPSCGRRGRIGRPDGPYGMARRPIGGLSLGAAWQRGAGRSAWPVAARPRGFAAVASAEARFGLNRVNGRRKWRGHNG